jgi:hypothetical protein
VLTYVLGKSQAAAFAGAIPGKRHPTRVQTARRKGKIRRFDSFIGKPPDTKKQKTLIYHFTFFDRENQGKDRKYPRNL